MVLTCVRGRYHVLGFSVWCLLVSAQYNRCFLIHQGCAGDALDMLLQDALGTTTNEDGEEQEPGFVQQVTRQMASLNRFMRSLQN